MGFGKPASYLSAIIFAVGAVSGVVNLIVSAVYGCVGLPFSFFFFPPFPEIADYID